MAVTLDDLADLADRCRTSILEMGPEARITLVVPRPVSGRSDFVRLAGRSGPLGRILCENSQGHTAAQFKAAEVLRWMARVLKDEVTRCAEVQP